MTQLSAKTTVIIARREDGEPTCATFEQQLADLCAARGLDVLLIPDLYHIPEDSDIWNTLADLPGPVAAFASLHPRPAEWILRAHDVGEEDLHTLDLAAYETADEALEALLSSLPASLESRGAVAEVREVQETVSPRWYPVIDWSRCINCQHCLQFCLFGVYELDEAGQVTPTSPDNCKDGCPACARICPQSAIMFPLHEHDKAIAGAPGEFVQLDPEARKMYYVRTETPCPLCDLVAEAGLGKAEGGIVCPECGRQPLSQSEAPAASLQSETLDEIDALIDQLEDMTRGG